jgi:hypothetical protein
VYYYRGDNESGNGAMLWPSRENYERFRALCDDILPRSFDEFISLKTRKKRKPDTEMHDLKLDFDPDAMASWCQLHFGRIDATARRFYASFLVLSRGIGSDGN